MNYFDWAVRFTVENYDPKGRKKSNRQQSIIFEVADRGHSFTRYHFLQPESISSPCKFKSNFLHCDIKVVWVFCFKFTMLLKTTLESQGPTPSLSHLRDSAVETVFQDGY